MVAVTLQRRVISSTHARTPSLFWLLFAVRKKRHGQQHKRDGKGGGRVRGRQRGGGRRERKRKMRKKESDKMVERGRRWVRRGEMDTMGWGGGERERERE